MNNYYVYHLIDPETQLPFYVGKGKNGRLYHHEGCVRNGKVPNNNKHLFYKIKSILAKGLFPTYKKVYENLSEQEAFDKEVEEEQRLKLQVKLCNIAPCGNKHLDTFTNHPDKEIIRQKIKDGLAIIPDEEKILSKQRRVETLWRRYGSANGLGGRTQSTESCAKRSQKLSGKNNPMYGKVFSEEHRRKISEAGKGKIISDETRKKISQIHTGKILSEETKQKIRIAKTGVKMSDEVRQNISKGHLGLVKSKETIEKLRIANTGRKRSIETKRALSRWASTRLGNKNPNFRVFSPEADAFIKDNITRSVYWIHTHLPENASYIRVKRRLQELRNHLS
jgi:hypothetical protein